MHDFVVDLAKGGKSFGDIKKLVDDVYADNALKKTQIYEILKRIKMGKNTDDRRGFNKQKTKMTADLIASVSDALAEDLRVSIQDLARAHGTLYGTISHILHSQLGLVKKSAHWVPKLLSKEERGKTSKEFVKLVQMKERSVLDRIITMDESSVSMHTPETKQQSKPWLKKGTPGPVKARVHASRTKTMVLAFFDSQGMVYTNYVPRGSTVNTKYIIRALGTFLKNLRKMRPETAKGEFLHWDNAPVHTAKVVQEFLAKKNIKLLSHPLIHLTLLQPTTSSSPS